ncbi:MAG: hypothetical protein EKK55_17335 [Rhodocyclaceae bacterium]|nr:MAG: hypothetical protein EKK55_17335 [Rhodocyclaceae bacterium]
MSDTKSHRFAISRNARKRFTADLVTFAVDNRLVEILGADLSFAKSILDLRSKKNSFAVDVTTAAHPTNQNRTRFRSRSINSPTKRGRDGDREIQKKSKKSNAEFSALFDRH